LILALAERGILETVPTAFGAFITVFSLLRWLNERDPSLRLPPKVRRHETRTLEGDSVND